VYPAARGQRGREPRGPAIKERLHVGGAELIADGLQAWRIGTCEEAIVETLERHARASQLLLDPFVAVETQLDRIREIGPDFQERRPPLGVLDVEVVVIDGDGLAREVERDATLRARTLVRLERPHLLLRHADHHDALSHRPPRAIVGDDVVLALAALERNQRHILPRRVGLDRADEAIEHGREQRRGRNGMPPVIPEEVAQAS
jgi:hypothetical protein